MSEGRKGSGRKGGQPEAGPGEPGRGGSAAQTGWIVSANVLAVLALVLAVVALVLYITEDDEEGSLTGAAGQPTATAQPTVVQPTPTPPIVVENVSVDDDPSWGPEDAPVTIVEFSEFLCPYCQRFAEQTLPLIQDAYEGKVRYVYRDFIVHGEPSLKISEAAECADDQGKFWEYHDNLWENYQAVGQQTGDIAGLVASLKTYAADLGLDTATFNDCLDSDKYASEVQKDSQDAASYGVTGTPGFFINGQLVMGAQPFDNFKAVIDAALQGGESGSALPTVPSAGG